MKTTLRRLAFLCLGLGTAVRGHAAEEILIGEYGSLTGSSATFGKSTHDGIMIALEEVNAAGGILGKKVKIITEDDQCKPDEAVNAVLKLIERDHVVAILGEVASSRSLAAAPICQKSQIPMLSPASTNEKVTQCGDFIFRSCFIDPFQGAIIAKFALNTLKAKTAAILTDKKQDYSVGLADVIKAEFPKLGGKLVADESYQSDDNEFKPQLTRIREAKPDVVFVPGYYKDCALIAKQARAIGLNVPLVGGDGWDSEITLQLGGDAVNGCYFTTHYHQDDPRPEVQAFIKKFKQLHNGKSPDSMAVLGYDAARILFDAIRRAGKTDGPAIRDALAATKDFQGVSGKVTLDKTRNAVKGIVMIKIDQKQFKFAELVTP